MLFFRLFRSKWCSYTCCKKAKEKFWMSAMHFKCIEGQAFRHHETINLIICVVIAIVFLVRDSVAETFFD